MTRGQATELGPDEAARGRRRRQMAWQSVRARQRAGHAPGCPGARTFGIMASLQRLGDGMACATRPTAAAARSRATREPHERACRAVGESAWPPRARHEAEAGPAHRLARRSSARVGMNGSSSAGSAHGNPVARAWSRVHGYAEQTLGGTYGVAAAHEHPRSTGSALPRAEA
jgi:hypothetical protein